METCANLQKKVKWDAITLLQWSSLEFTGDVRKFWRNYRERASLDETMYDWDMFKSELIHLYGNRLSKEEAQQKILALRHTGTTDEYLKEILSLESDVQIGASFLRTTITDNVRPSLKRRILESRKQPSSWPHWVEWVRDMGRTDQAAYRRLKDPAATASTSRRGERPTSRAENTPRIPAPPRSHTSSRPPRAATTVSASQPDLGATPVENERWKKEKRSFRCGRGNHLAKDCHVSTKISSLKRGRDPRQHTGKKEVGNEKGKSQTEAFRVRITSLEEQ